MKYLSLHIDNMTYNQITNKINDLLLAHPMIKSVKNFPPKEWILITNQVVYPIACFTINSGTINKGLEQIFNVQIFFLDKSGVEAEFENDVISDQVQIATDIIQGMRGLRNNYSVDDLITYNTIADKYEDYLAGCEITFNLITQGEFDSCDTPT